MNDQTLQVDATQEQSPFHSLALSCNWQMNPDADTAENSDHRACYPTPFPCKSCILCRVGALATDAHLHDTLHQQRRLK